MLFTHFNDIKRHKGEGISNISTERMCLIYLVFNVAEPVGRKPSSGHNYTVVEYFRYISNACSYVTMQPFVIPRKLITFNACIKVKYLFLTRMSLNIEILSIINALRDKL